MINDRIFFTELIDIEKHPELSLAKEKAEINDNKAARAIFAKYIREKLNPDLFFNAPEFKSDDIFMYHDETENDAAERILNHELISCGIPHKFNGKIDWFLNPTYNQYKEWTWQLSRHADWKLLAKMYRATKDERYAECIVDFFTSWYEQAIAPDENTEGHLTLCWRTIEAGIRMGNVWAYVLHVLYNSPSFTDDILVDWYKSVWEHGNRLHKKHRIGNWLVIEMHGLVYIGVIYDVFKKSSMWKDYALTKLNEELDKQIYPDGFQYELSTNYHKVVLARYADIVVKCKAYGVALPASFKEKLANMYDLYIKLVMPDGRLPDLNDGIWGDVSKYMIPTKLLYPNREDYRYFRTNCTEGNEPPFKSVYLPYSGIAVMRDGWKKNSIWALVDVGPFGRGHQHEDKLNILMYAYGHMLLTEGGDYAYDTSEMRSYVLSTRSHNCIRVDNNDQNRRLTYTWNDSDINKLSDSEMKSNEEYDIVIGHYNDKFGNSDIKVKHERKVVFLKKNTPKCFIVIDRLYPEDNEIHKYEILWHLVNKGYEVNKNKVISTDEDKPTLTILTPNIDISTKVVCGQTEPYWQGWQPTAHMVQGKYEPSPCAIYELETKGAIRLCTLLLPYPNNSDIVKDIVASTNVDDTDIKIIFHDGNVINFNETIY